MKMVKVERGGINAEGIVVGDDVRIFGEWRRGPADAAPFDFDQLHRQSPIFLKFSRYVARP